MHAKKIAASLFAFALCLTFSGFAGAASEASTATEKDAGKSCCRHESSAAGSAGAHCAHAAKDAEGHEGKSCCSEHASAKKDGEKSGCCCCQDACAHPGAKDTPAKS